MNYEIIKSIVVQFYYGESWEYFAVTLNDCNSTEEVLALKAYVNCRGRKKRGTSIQMIRETYDVGLRNANFLVNYFLDTEEDHEECHHPEEAKAVTHED